MIYATVSECQTAGKNNDFIEDTISRQYGLTHTEAAVTVVLLKDTVNIKYYYLGATFYLTIFAFTLFFWGYEGNYRDIEGFENFFAAFQFVFVTMTTVGYGDISPATETGRWVGIFFILLSITLLGSLF